MNIVVQLLLDLQNPVAADEKPVDGGKPLATESAGHIHSTFMYPGFESLDEKCVHIQELYRICTL